MQYPIKTRNILVLEQLWALYIGNVKSIIVF